jgi:hypothetical protein
MMNKLASLLTTVLLVAGALVVSPDQADAQSPCYHCQSTINCDYGLCNPITPAHGRTGCTGGCYSECTLSGGTCSFEGDPPPPDGELAGALAADGSLRVARLADEVGTGLQVIRRSCDGAIIRRQYTAVRSDELDHRLKRLAL